MLNKNFLCVAFVVKVFSYHLCGWLKPANSWFSIIHNYFLCNNVFFFGIGLKYMFHTQQQGTWNQGCSRSPPCLLCLPAPPPCCPPWHLAKPLWSVPICKGPQGTWPVWVSAHPSCFLSDIRPPPSAWPTITQLVLHIYTASISAFKNSPQVDDDRFVLRGAAM